MRAFIGMETSGVMRRAFAARGHDVISCDLLPADDGAPWNLTGTIGNHWVGDVFDTLDTLKAAGWWPDLAIFHPTCTYHTVSAAWAFSDPDFERYPGVGYHQRVQADTLTGQARRDARTAAEADMRRIRALPFLKVVENPRGTLGRVLGKPADVVQPYEFGDDASKGTCLWAFDARGNPVPLTLTRDPAKRVAGRVVNGVERWRNQTDSGQNRLTPGDDRWKDRSATYPGIADAVAEQLSR